MGILTSIIVGCAVWVAGRGRKIVDVVLVGEQISVDLGLGDDELNMLLLRPFQGNN